MLRLLTIAGTIVGIIVLIVTGHGGYVLVVLLVASGILWSLPRAAHETADSYDEAVSSGKVHFDNGTAAPGETGEQTVRTRFNRNREGLTLTNPANLFVIDDELVRAPGVDVVARFATDFELGGFREPHRSLSVRCLAYHTSAFA